MNAVFLLLASLSSIIIFCSAANTYYRFPPPYCIKTLLINSLLIWDVIGGFLLVRTLAVLSTMTLGTSMAAHEGPVGMAAHQICIQVWLAVSLLVDALGASAQV